MTEAMLASFARDTLIVTMEVAMPILIVGLVVGVAISLFQAVTQISELTLTFVPKLLAILAVVVILGPWMLRTMLRFTAHMFSSLPLMVH
jgi:flagellar biosynthetic protein FliQ